MSGAAPAASPDRPELWPLHPEQRRILHAQARAPDSSKYNVGGYVRMVGPFDQACFIGALERFWRDCDSERVEIPWSDGAPRQRFRDDCAMPPPALLGFGGGEAREQALAWMQSRMDEPLPLSRFPLFDHVILRFEGQETWYFSRHHHIIADAFAFSLKIGAVLECYAALRGGSEAPDSRLGSYRAEIEAALAYLESPQLGADLEYWSERLAQPPAGLWPAEPGDGVDAMRARPIGVSEIPIDERVRSDLSALCAEARVSPLHVLIACIAVHLGGDLIIGVPVHNRTRLRQKRTFGVLSAIVPTRVRADLRQPFGAVAREAAVALGEDLAHRHVPLWEIVRQLRAAEPGRRALFEVVVNYEPFVETPAAGGLTITTHELVSATEHVPLHIRLCDFGAHQPLVLRVQLMDGFHPGGAAAFSADLHATLAAVLKAPDRPLSDVVGAEPPRQ